MPRSRFCWLSEKWNFNFARIFRHRHAHIAKGWPLQNSECNFMMVIWHRHASIAILLAVRKVKVQFYVGNLMSACAKWRSVVQRCTFTDACNHMIYAKRMECCSKLDFPWKRLAAQSSQKWWSVFQNHTSTAWCANLDFAKLIECCFKIDFHG